MRTVVSDWGKSVITREMVEGKRVLEVGSMNVNGSLRPYVESFGPEYYVGVDLAQGPGVDNLVNATGLLDAYGSKKWDLVISTEMLEHCHPWQEAVYQMKESLVDGGWIVLTSVGQEFPEHDWPGDYWRYTGTIFTEALSDLEDLVVETPDLNVFAIGRRNGEVTRPQLEALPVTIGKGIGGIYIWPELDIMLANAVHAVRAGALSEQAVIGSFMRFKEALGIKEES